MHTSSIRRAHHAASLDTRACVAWARGLALAASLMHLSACGSSTPQAVCEHPGGPATGAQDAHCAAQTPQSVDASTCAEGAPDASSESTAGSSTDSKSVYGPTMFNTEGDDDDCKYHVVWRADTICENANVMFFVTPTYLVDGSSVTGAMPRLEVFLNATTPAPNTVQTVTQTSPGNYSVGPIRFDKPGQWTIRWHLFEYCSDFAPSSPHGHAAFYVNVP